MSFFYQDGFVPYCIGLISGYDAVWDGTTRFPAEVGFPSFETTGYVPVVGDGTLFPLGLTLNQLGKFYWNFFSLKVNNFSASIGYDITSVITCFGPPPDFDPFDKTIHSLAQCDGNFTIDTGDYYQNIYSSGNRTKLACQNSLQFHILPFQGTGNKFSAINFQSTQDCDSTSTSTTTGFLSFDFFMFGPFDSSSQNIYYYNNKYYPSLNIDSSFSAGIDVSFTSFNPINNDDNSAPWVVTNIAVALGEDNLDFNCFYRIPKDTSAGTTSTAYNGRMDFDLEIVPWPET